MTRRLIAAVLFAVAALTGCESMPVEQMNKGASILTTGGDGERFTRTPITQFKLEDRILLITSLSWGNVDSGAGTHEVLWTWYQGDTPLTKVKRRFDFYQTPFELYGNIPASVLGVGAHRVEVQIDGKAFDLQQFTVIEK